MSDDARIYDEKVLQESQLIVLRQMSDNLTRLNARLDRHETQQDKIFQYISEIEKTLAVQNERQLSTGKLEARIEALEAVRQQQKGAAGLVIWLKDFGPWIGTLLLLAWGLFTRKPI